MSGYARVLFVAAAPDGAASYTYRLQEVFRAQRHALCVIDPHEGESVSELVQVAFGQFDPSLVLWDEKTVPLDEGACEFLSEKDVLFAVLRHPVGAEAQGRCDALITVGAKPRMGESDLLLTAAPDRSYQQAVLADASVKRHGVVLPQPEGKERYDASVGGTCDLPLIDFRVFGRDPAFQARLASICVYFHGTNTDASESVGIEEICLRMAEGLIVCLEDSLAAELREQSFTDVNADAMVTGSLATFSRATLSNLLADLTSSGEGSVATLMREREQKLLSSLVPLDEDVPVLLENLHRLAAERGKRAVLCCEQPAVRPVLYGWYGADNFGDDLLMTFLASRFRRRFKNAEVKVIGARPEAIRRQFGFEAPDLHSKAEVHRALKGASVMTLSGGLLFDYPMATTAGDLEFLYDPWSNPACQAATSLLARVLDTPTVGIGLGVGPLENPAPQHMARLLGLSGALLMTRDEQSSQLLLKAGVPPTQVETFADLAFGAADFISTSAARSHYILPEQPYFVVALRDFYLNPADFENRIAHAVDGIVVQTGLTAVFLPFDKTDVAIHERVRARMAQREKSIAIGERLPMDDLFAVMKGSSLGFAMRLHCSIIHHVLGKPAVGLNYNDKVQSHFENLGLAECLGELDESADTYVARAAACYENREELAQRIRPLCERNAQLVEEALEKLFTIAEEAAMKNRAASAAVDDTSANDPPSRLVIDSRFASIDQIEAHRLEGELRELRAAQSNAAEVGKSGADESPSRTTRGRGLLRRLRSRQAQ